MRASYVEPSTNKGSFRFGSCLHFLKDFTATVRPGLVRAVFLGRVLDGEGEQLAPLVGRWVGVQLPAGIHGREGGGVWNVLRGGCLWEEVL